jgi:hypothetical protein
VTLPDLAGVFGVGLILIAYAGASTGRMDATKWPALTLNLVGAVLILVSLAYDFNVASFLMEAAWALVALAGLVRVALGRRSRG